MNISRIGVIFIAVLTMVSCSNTFIWNDEVEIRKHLLESTPVGTSAADVRTAIETNGFAISATVQNSGYTYRFKPDNRRITVGSGYTKAYLGHYRILWRVDVVAVWIFDADNRLLDIAVHKQADAL